MAVQYVRRRFWTRDYSASYGSISSGIPPGSQGRDRICSVRDGLGESKMPSQRYFQSHRRYTAAYHTGAVRNVHVCTLKESYRNGTWPPSIAIKRANFHVYFAVIHLSAGCFPHLSQLPDLSMIPSFAFCFASPLCHSKIVTVTDTWSCLDRRD